MSLKYFEGFIAGECATAGEYLVTEAEIIEFASKWDPQPFHVDLAAAEASVFGGLTACGHPHHRNAKLADPPAAEQGARARWSRNRRAALRGACAAR